MFASSTHYLQFPPWNQSSQRVWIIIFKVVKFSNAARVSYQINFLRYCLRTRIDMKMASTPSIREQVTHQLRQNNHLHISKVAQSQ